MDYVGLVILASGCDKAQVMAGVGEVLRLGAGAYVKKPYITEKIGVAISPTTIHSKIND